MWFTDSRYWWLGCTHFPPCNLPVSRGVLLFYCAETGFYLQAIHFLIFHEVRASRKVNMCASGAVLETGSEQRNIHLRMLGCLLPHSSRGMGNAAALD